MACALTTNDRLWYAKGQLPITAFLVTNAQVAESRFPGTMIFPMSVRGTNPFKVGDRVCFQPNERTIGWSWSSFDRVRLEPGAVGTVSRVQDEQYLYLDDDRGGFHWECFQSVA